MIRKYAYSVKAYLDCARICAYHVSMELVNERIRQAVRVELAKRNTNQAKLAEEIGVSRQYLSDIMRGKSGNVPDVWERIFNALSLELSAGPKDGFASSGFGSGAYGGAAYGTSPQAPVHDEDEPVDSESEG